MFLISYFCRRYTKTYMREIVQVSKWVIHLMGVYVSLKPVSLKYIIMQTFWYFPKLKKNTVVSSMCENVKRNKDTAVRKKQPRKAYSRSHTTLIPELNTNNVPLLYYIKVGLCVSYVTLL
jgi:hypothetical protein